MPGAIGKRGTPSRGNLFVTGWVGIIAPVRMAAAILAIAWVAAALPSRLLAAAEIDWGKAETVDVIMTEYRFSPDRLVFQRQRKDSVSLDLAAAIVARFRRCGVMEEHIHIASACTRCRADLFHSYRRRGSGGPLMAAVGMIA